MFAMRKTSQYIPWWRKSLYATAVVVLLVACLEAVLFCFGVRPVLATRDPFVGFESAIPLFVERPDSVDAKLVTAENKLELFNRQEFPKHKSPGTSRIFCLGGSTTFGRPYDDTTSFPGWLREILPSADSSRNWEVINAGGVSYASYRVATLMEELTAYEPDLFIVYSGHNEFLERRSYGRLRSMPVMARQAAAFLSRTRTYSLLYSTLDEYRLIGQQPCILPVEVDPMLDHVDGPTIYVRDDDLRSQIIRHYETNINRMADIAGAAGARILLITPTSNIKDCSPFRSQHDDHLTDAEYEQWKRLFQRGQELEAQGKLADAIQVYLEASEIDQRFAAVHFRLGQLYLALNRVDDAQLSFERARDEDVCPLRAPRPLAEIVRQVAVHRGVTLVDFDSAIRNDCLQKHGHTAIGREYFLDHVHLTIAANRMLAISIFDEMARGGLAQPHPSWNEHDIEELTARVESRIDARAHAAALRNLARVFWWAGKRDEAGALALQALEQIPNDPDSLIVAAAHLRGKNQRRESLEYFCHALTQRPFEAAAYHFAGVEWFELGELEMAQFQIREALKLHPEDAELHCQLGDILLASGKQQDAIVQYAEALRVAPGYRKAQKGIRKANQANAGS